VCLGSGAGLSAGAGGWSYGQWYAKFCKFGQYKTLAEFEAEMATWDESMSVARGNIRLRVMR
jgi:hypothetical protein